MEMVLDERLPILEVAGSGMVSAAGDFTVGFEVGKPEIFTLSERDYSELHQAFVRALRVLPVGTIFHMQDWYLKDYHLGGVEKAEGFLGMASERFFHERGFLRHISRVYFTMRTRKMPTSATSGMLRHTLVPAELLRKEKVRDFETAVGQFAGILTDGKQISLRRLEDGELASGYRKTGVIEGYCFLREGGGERVIRDIQFTDTIRVGEFHALLCTLADPEKLPTACAPANRYERFSTDKTLFPIGMVSGLGALLYSNHIYNQYICIEDTPAAVKRLEARRLRLKSLSGYSRANAIGHEATQLFLNEALEGQKSIVRAHFNVMAWADDVRELKDIRNCLYAAMAGMDARAHIETQGAPQIWWAGIPGNEGELPVNETFETFLEQACCFFSYETQYRDSTSAFGIRLGDRLTGKPVFVDLSDEPMKQLWTTNRNKILLGPSGSGKSFFVCHLLRSYWEQGCHIVVVDVGHSYSGLCSLVDGYYFTYSEREPIRFNPFYLAPGDHLDTEKKESIKTLLLALWKRSDEAFHRSEYVALSKALQLFYERLSKEPGVFPCFNTFYDFLREEYAALMSRDQVKAKEFDLENFLYVLRPYYQGGEFDYLLNARENLDLIKERFIVFELDAVKDHPILFPVVTIIIMEVFISKMRRLKGARKMIVIEEAWKAIAREGMAEYIKYLFKTVRKFFGEAMVVTQEVEDILSSPIVKEAVINNADCKILLDQRKYQHRFEQVQAFLGLTDMERTLALSVNKACEPGARYKEVFISLGGHAKVYRTEVSLEEQLAYTTEETEKLRVAEYAKRHGSMRRGIETLAREIREKENA